MTSQHDVAGPWAQNQIDFASELTYANPYRDVEVWVDFTHEGGATVRRPAFWVDGRTFAVRFAAGGKSGRWTWRSHSEPADPGLDERSGRLTVVDVPSDNVFLHHGFWGMSPTGRSLVHADGRPAILAADTAWALPWRATAEQVREYAQDRQAKGYNAVLLMTVQPDMDATGPRNRYEDTGFDVGFEDLADGRLEHPNPAYFATLDELLGILTAHELVPVLQPVFFGYGWKGRRVAGPVVPPADYARYCRYLVARYGAAPAIYLVGADGSGWEPQVEAGGREVRAWDAYHQPIGIHYRPHSTAAAHQDAHWLDFQWCQTGHGGEHVPERVAAMFSRFPAKAVANGEPTYENSGRAGKAAGWWQGHEAWSNLCAGATMGVVYGAGSMWQWVLRPAEPDHSDFFLGPGAGWREALHFEGSHYVGLLRRILDDLPTTDMTPNWDLAVNPHGLGVPGVLHILYLEDNHPVPLTEPARLPPCYTAIDPRDAHVIAEGTLPDAHGGHFMLAPDPDYQGPVVILFTRALDVRRQP